MNNITSLNSQTMSSLEIAMLTGKQHKHVMRDIDNIVKQLKKESPDLGSGFKSSAYLAGNGKREKCYELSRDGTVLLMTGYSIPMRAKLVRRWSELEAKDQNGLPHTFAEALQLAADQQKEIERKNELILASNEASIKAGEILVREFCKAHNFIIIGQNKMFDWLKKQGLIMKSTEPYQQYISRGYFSWKPTQESHGGKVRYTLRITPRGKVWLAARYLKYLDNKDMAA